MLFMETLNTKFGELANFGNKSSRAWMSLELVGNYGEKNLDLSIYY